MSTHKQKKRFIKRLVLSLSAAAVAITIAVVAYFVPFRKLLPAIKLPSLREGEVRLHFLDVGQGDCAIVEFSAGDILVIDAGDGSYEHNNLLARYLKALKPEHISMLLTHPDSDHFGGFPTLLQLYGAEKFYLPVMAEESKDYLAFIDAVNSAGCEQEIMSRYKTIERESCSLVCLSPFPTGETEENAASTVLYFDCGGVNALLSGDMTAVRERKLLEEYKLDETFFDAGDLSVSLENIEILKMPHHGSAYSSSEEWLEFMKPETAIISCGAGNRYGHPAEEALSRLRAASPEAEIYRTDELGSIMISIYEGNYTVWSDI